MTTIPISCPYTLRFVNSYPKPNLKFSSIRNFSSTNTEIFHEATRVSSLAKHSKRPATCAENVFRAQTSCQRQQKKHIYDLQMREEQQHPTNRDQKDALMSVLQNRQHNSRPIQAPNWRNRRTLEERPRHVTRGSAGANSSNLRENELIGQESKSRGAKTCCMTAQGA